MVEAICEKTEEVTGVTSKENEYRVVVYARLKKVRMGPEVVEVRVSKRRKDRR